MSNATPILYLNMGGEMLYVLQQRLHTQKISPDKTIQVMNEVISALLEPKQLDALFAARGPTMGLSQLRPLLERVVLSSIMKLDANSMNKLFDLMIMMVKYQLTTASGPREIVLSTLNHLDAIRDMALMDRNLGQRVDASHRLVLETYGQMTHAEIWQLRDQCLSELQSHSVRVSILLRLGMQNQDASFNRLRQRYDEKYQERRELLEPVKLIEHRDQEVQGSLELYGDRVTLLGKNAYCSGYGQATTASSLASPDSSQSLNHGLLARSNKAMRLELQTLATQLGQEETASGALRPFSLHLVGHLDNDKLVERPVEQNPDDNCNPKIEQPPEASQPSNDNDNYKSSLIRNVDSQFADNDNADSTDNVDLMNLLDIL